MASVSAIRLTHAKTSGDTVGVGGRVGDAGPGAERRRPLDRDRSRARVSARAGDRASADGAGAQWPRSARHRSFGRSSPATFAHPVTPAFLKIRPSPLLP